VGSGNADGWFGGAFGLVLAGDLPLESVAPVRPARRVDTRLERASRAAVDGRWRSARPHKLLERRLVDGSVGLSVERDEEIGFRIWAPRHGCYLVTPDGRRVIAAPPSGPAWRWERLVLAQVLPLAAVLRGTHVLHASAVALAGRAVAFMGRSGVGKTTLAGRIVAHGALLMTDDVLAVDESQAAVRAHRGGAVARIDPRELRAMTPEERRALGAVKGRGEKWHVTPALAPARLPLGLTYHLVRPAAVEGTQIVAVDPYDPALLLGNAFLPYLTDPGRLRRQLEVCAAIADVTPLYQVRVGPRAASADVARTVLRHARSALGERRER
jgi:hypothetical protein